MTTDISTPKKPFANSYWVQPGALLAGEYPLVKSEEQSARRLQDLLLSGVTCFINLTAVDELPEYVGSLPLRFGGKAVRHLRFTIPDHGVPQQMQSMHDILDAIEAALRDGDVVYVHCRAGIGRTGTVIGCHLARQDLSGVQALERLNALWQDCGRAGNWPAIPETDAQEQFIRDFAATLQSSNSQASNAAVTHEQPLAVAAPASLQARYQGAVLGLAIADVVGHVGLNGAPDTPVPGLGQGVWGGDAAMMWALADSLLHCRQMRANDQVQRYLAWQRQGRYSSHGQAVDVPPVAQKALALSQWKRLPLAGSHDPAVTDAHPLARVTAVVLYYAAQPAVCVHEAAESARTTLQSPIVLDACRVYAAFLSSILQGMPMAELLQGQQGAAFTALRASNLKPELFALLQGGWRHALQQPAGEDIVSVLASAIHALATTQDFSSAVQRAMQGAARPATVAAVTGALAGAFYEVNGLPLVWRETLPQSAALMQLANDLLKSVSAA